MTKDVKVFTLTNNAAIAVIIISFVCYAETLKWASNSVFRLDMAPDSVDDQYNDCTDRVYKRIKNKILPKELNSNKKFANAWNMFGSDDDYLRIIKVYTSSAIYAKFNAAVRSGRNNYKRTFHFKAAHFLLTGAIQKYKVKQCVNVFRRTNVNFDTNVLGREMRFGSFTSSSLKTNLYFFGTISCFSINTCFGAHIAQMSVYPQEDEVLIPPFEKFRITNIAKNQMNCGVLYTLQSTGKHSNMNCEMFKTNTAVNHGK